MPRDLLILIWPWLLILIFCKVTRRKAGTLSGRCRSNGYVQKIKSPLTLALSRRRGNRLGDAEDIWWPVCCATARRRRRGGSSCMRHASPARRAAANPCLRYTPRLCKNRLRVPPAMEINPILNSRERSRPSSWAYEGLFQTLGSSSSRLTSVRRSCF